MNKGFSYCDRFQLFEYQFGADRFIGIQVFDVYQILTSFDIVFLYHQLFTFESLISADSFAIHITDINQPISGNV